MGFRRLDGLPVWERPVGAGPLAGDTHPSQDKMFHLALGQHPDGPPYGGGIVPWKTLGWGWGGWMSHGEKVRVVLEVLASHRQEVVPAQAGPNSGQLSFWALGAPCQSGRVVWLTPGQVWVAPPELPPRSARGVRGGEVRVTLREALLAQPTQGSGRGAAQGRGDLRRAQLFLDSPQGS